jgi:hypothetical protein
VFKNIIGIAVGAVAVSVMLCTSNARAASISWGDPNLVDITTPTQVLTNGTLVYAGFLPSYYFTDSPANTEIVVNGVAFTQNLLNNTDVGSGSWSGPYGPASNAYSELLADGLFNQDLGTHTTTITGLTAGDNYEVQVFTSFWGADSGFQTQLISGSNMVDMGQRPNHTHLRRRHLHGGFHQPVVPVDRRHRLRRDRGGSGSRACCPRTRNGQPSAPGRSRPSAATPTAHLSPRNGRKPQNNARRTQTQLSKSPHSISPA